MEHSGTRPAGEKPVRPDCGVRSSFRPVAAAPFSCSAFTGRRCGGRVDIERTFHLSDAELGAGPRPASSRPSRGRRGRWWASHPDRSGRGRHPWRCCALLIWGSCSWSRRSRRISRVFAPAMTLAIAGRPHRRRDQRHRGRRGGPRTHPARAGCFHGLWNIACTIGATVTGLASSVSALRGARCGRASRSSSSSTGWSPTAPACRSRSGWSIRR